MYHRTTLIEQTDPEIFAAIQAENARQEQHIELIASENYASPAVMAAQGSQLTNKYAKIGGRLAAFDPVANLRVGVKVLQECITRAGSIEGGLKY